MFFVVLMSGLVQLLVWNFVDNYPGIVSAFEKNPSAPKSDDVQMAMSTLYGFFAVCFWSLVTPVCSSISPIPANLSLEQ